MGVILTKPRVCRLRRGDEEEHRIPFRCVVSRSYDQPSRASLLRTPCEDGAAVKHASCACKTFFWFLRAPSLHPDAAFIAKVEDDTIVHYDALLSVLASVPRSTYAWMSLFQWAAQQQVTFRGNFCGTGARMPQKRVEECRRGANVVTTAFASGGFDLRGAELARETGRCRPAAFANFGSCDGGHGVHLLKCMHRRNITVQMHDLKWTSWKHFAGPQVLVLHNVKDMGRNRHWKVNLTRMASAVEGRAHAMANKSLIMRTRPSSRPWARDERSQTLRPASTAVARMEQASLSSELASEYGWHGYTSKDLVSVSAVSGSLARAQSPTRQSRGTEAAAKKAASATRTNVSNKRIDTSHLRRVVFGRQTSQGKGEGGSSRSMGSAKVLYSLLGLNR